AGGREGRGRRLALSEQAVYSYWLLVPEPNGEGGRETALTPAAHDDNAFVFQAFQRGDSRLLGEAGAPIQGVAIDPLDPVADLVKRDGVGLLVEAERAAHDIGEDLEFGARQVRHDVVQ